jgi:predicted dinucleotide-utilizing enzyme
MLYYGSNMNWPQMQQRCPSTRFVDRATLPDYKLAVTHRPVRRGCGVVSAVPQAGLSVHHIEVEADSARFSMTIENIPSENPRTGRVAALSAVACLRGLVATLRIGT